ncbi:MAG: PSD1 domain-containing protein [Planctomycetes bacterium]|nr:PSD1 domain-containing protein [Planctomycetota bacterium]
MNRIFHVLAAVVLYFGLAAAPASAGGKNTKGIEFFEAKIRPVLVAKCYECHSAKSSKIKGGLLLDTKAGVLAGGDNGPIIVAGNPNASPLIHSLRHEGDTKMPPKTKLPATVIRDFADWIAMGAPDPRVGKGAAKGYKTMTLAEAKTFWAFQLPKRVPAPNLKDAAWARGPIDQFVLGKMQEKGLAPVADADRTILLRRLSFDIVGLPPTPEEIDAFLADKSAKAVEKVVDRLLASPHYGERWGRHWLDVARYAETNGNADNVLFPTAFRYRDYVIAAYNSDKPYDRFIQEQVAGDLLPVKDAGERDQNLTATGLLALTSRPRAQNNPDYKHDLIADQIDVTTRAVIALSVMCARCHDHKFDAISTRDYYAMAGLFDSSLMLFGNNAGKKGGKGAGFHSLSTGAQVMGIRDSVPTDCRVCIRGEARNLGEKVERGFITVLKTDTTPKVDRTKSGRLQMAQWLTSKDNPLTARVAVNRIWLHLFGQGIVRSPDNFGNLGERPTDPELLDHLALRFMENGWSTKKMIKEIVLSRTYQLSSSHHDGNFKTDPDTMFLWRMPVRRLEAEAIRDAILAVSGKLNREPYKGTMLTGPAKKKNPKKGPKGPILDNSYHRTVYLAMVRGRPLPELLALFDIANPNLVVAQREVTTVPAQALFMINSPFAVEQSRYFARRLTANEKLDDAGRVRLAYRYALGRNPSESEQQRALDYLREVTKTNQAQAWTSFCQTLYASAEFRYLR